MSGMTDAARTVPLMDALALAKKLGMLVAVALLRASSEDRNDAQLSAAEAIRLIEEADPDPGSDSVIDVRVLGGQAIREALAMMERHDGD